jgi:hypothetical protein
MRSNQKPYRFRPVRHHSAAGLTRRPRALARIEGPESIDGEEVILHEKVNLYPVTLVAKEPSNNGRTARQRS